MKWKDEYSVGVSALDADHKRLFEIINRIDEAADDGAPIGWVVDELSDYVRFHFLREEFRLVDAGYPEVDRHFREHAEFRDWLETLRANLRATPLPGAAVTAAVSDYLKDWLSNHILKSDMDYRACLADAPQPREASAASTARI